MFKKEREELLETGMREERAGAGTQSQNHGDNGTPWNCVYTETPRMRGANSEHL